MDSLNWKVDINRSHVYELGDDWQQYEGKYTRYAEVTYPDNYPGVGGVVWEEQESLRQMIYADNPSGVITTIRIISLKQELLVPPMLRSPILPISPTCSSLYTERRMRMFLSLPAGSIRREILSIMSEIFEGKNKY